MDFVARYRQVFESYFRRAIKGSCHLHPEHYRDIFVVQFRGTIQVLRISIHVSCLGLAVPSWIAYSFLAPVH
jgi:hypothetical protein